MAIPTEKNPEIDKLLKSMSPVGADRVEAIKADKCTWCEADASWFKDELSKKEYTISGLCQACQDKTFGR